MGGCPPLPLAAATTAPPMKQQQRLSVRIVSAREMSILYGNTYNTNNTCNLFIAQQNTRERMRVEKGRGGGSYSPAAGNCVALRRFAAACKVLTASRMVS